MLMFSVWLTSVSSAAVADVKAAGNADVRAAIAKSLPFIEKGGNAWIEEHGCVTCHRVSMMTWSMSEAARHGFKLDQEKLDSTIDWSLTALLKKGEKGEKGENGDGRDLVGSGNLEGLAQVLLSNVARDKAIGKTKAMGAFVKLIVDGQQKDGSWKANGQLPFQKRSARETIDVSTMWLLLALNNVGERGVPAETIAKARKFGSVSKPGKSTEWYVVRLLLNGQIGNAKWIASATKRLRSHQRDDGGWGWLVGDESDALATGMALYALRVTGTSSSDAAVQRATAFLIKTQLKDGSWAVRSTKEKKKTKIQKTAIYWGTTWATLGLLEMLPVLSR